MMANQEKRRGTDQVQQQIEALIMAASDPKDKAFLLIMNKIAISLDTNTYLTQGLSDEFKIHTEAFRKHEENDLQLLSKGKGGIMIGLYLLGIIQILAGYIISGQLDDVKEIKGSLVKVQNAVLVHTEQIRTLNTPPHP